MANKRLAKKRAKQEAAKAVEVKVEAPVVEEAVVERIGRQCREVEGQDRVPGPGENPFRPLAEFKIGGDETDPHENEGDKRKEEEKRIDIQNLRPAKPRKYAPCRIRQVIGKRSPQKAAVACGP